MEVISAIAFVLPDPEHSSVARAALVTGYVAASFCWLRVGLQVNQPQDRACRRWWMIGACLLLFLALNKYFDLRNHVETALRAMAETQGWYRGRRPEQFLLAIGLPCLAALLLGALLLTKARPFAGRQPWAVCGWVLLLVYLALRQSQEWKPVLPWLDSINYHAWRLALELVGLLLVVIAALRPAEPSREQEDNRSAT